MQRVFLHPAHSKQLRLCVKRIIYIAIQKIDINWSIRLLNIFLTRNSTETLAEACVQVSQQAVETAIFYKISLTEKMYSMQKNHHLVIGLGLTGLSCVRYLISKNRLVSVVDTRENPPKLSDCQKEFPNVKIHLGKFQESIFSQADTLIVSPGMSLAEPCIVQCIEKNIPVMGDVELFARDAKAPIVAITGSNGKSTLTTLMGDIINNVGKKAIICGNIGLPVLEAMMQPTPDYYVVELSSFQLDTTYSLKAKVAVVINVSPDHMDRYATIADYLASK